MRLRHFTAESVKVQMHLWCRSIEQFIPHTCSGVLQYCQGWLHTASCVVHLLPRSSTYLDPTAGFEPATSNPKKPLYQLS